MSGIPLARMLADLRTELATAQAEGAEQSIVFEMQYIELELQMTTTQDAEVKGGVKFWVVNAEGGGKQSVVGGHTLKLRMRAKERGTGKSVEINSASTPMP